MLEHNASSSRHSSFRCRTSQSGVRNIGMATLGNCLIVSNSASTVRGICVPTRRPPPVRQYEHAPSTSQEKSTKESSFNAPYPARFALYFVYLFLQSEPPRCRRGCRRDLPSKLLHRGACIMGWTNVAIRG